MNKQQVRGLRGVLFAFSSTLLLGTGSLGFPQEPHVSPSAVETATGLAGVFEALEAGEDPGVAEVPDPEAVGSAYRALEEHLGTYADDVPALISLARLGRILTLMQPVVLNSGEPPPPLAPTLERCVAALNRAITLEPDNAEAHYWLARCYGVTVSRIIDGRLRKASLDSDQAIAHARHAVTAAPTEMKYREALAIYLLSAQRHTEAFEAFGDDDAARKHALRRILGDFAAIPLPEGATFSPLQSATTAESLAGSGRLEDYAAFRVRVFAGPGTRAPFEAAFRRQWPEFELVELGRREGEDGSETIGLAQILQERDGMLQPMSPREVERARGRRTPEGVSVLVQEISNPSPELLEWHGLAAAERVTVLTLIDLRKTQR